MEPNNIEDVIIDSILERPIQFKVDGKKFKIYPLTLGKMLIFTSLLKQIDVNEELLTFNQIIESMRVSEANPGIVANIIAYACCKGKDEVMDFDRVNNMTKFFKGISVEDRASLLNCVMTLDKSAAIINHFGIDKELEYMNRAIKAKKQGSDLSFCAKSIWGQKIDPVCERYGWSVDYVLWELSYNNLSLLTADQLKTVYLTEEERKKVHIPGRCGEVLKADRMTADEIKEALNLK